VDILDYLARKLEELARERGEERGEPMEVDPVEEELDEREFDACEEVKRLLKEREDELFWEGRCDWSSGGGAVEVALYGGTVTVPGEILEAVRGALERHGLTVERFEIEARAGDFVVEVTIRFRVALPADDERLLAGAQWLFSPSSAESRPTPSGAGAPEPAAAGSPPASR